MVFVFSVFVLALLVLIDHATRYKRQPLIYYKNDHRFSVIVAVTKLHVKIDRLFEIAENSPHEFIFVNVNATIDQEFYEGANIIEVNHYVDPDDPVPKITLLTAAYNEGVKHASMPFLLFLDADLSLESQKVLGHMANNLVEHQLITLKATYERKSAKDGCKLFFDFFRDVNLTSDRINISFFAVKRQTYELIGCGNKIYSDVVSFEEDVLKRNVNIVHIRNDDAVEKVETFPLFRDYIKNWLFHFSNRASRSGILRMSLYLLALNAFYFGIVFNFHFVNLFLLVLVHVGFWLVTRPFTKHHPLAYVLIPFHMLVFDVFFFTGSMKRLVSKLRRRWAER